eukprot:GHUV01012936.1.p2 GENE.GHUV01012936.1~~GHUV01012936.1.p2  ORF type:complete len:110 (-),score=8.75 GHUV01012936.1:735-1064(-)
MEQQRRDLRGRPATKRKMTQLVRSHQSQRNERSGCARGAEEQQLAALPPYHAAALALLHITIFSHLTNEVCHNHPAPCYIGHRASVDLLHHSRLCFCMSAGFAVRTAVP